MRQKGPSHIALAVFLASAWACRPALEPPPDAPKLVVLIVVDQLGGERLQRFDQVFTGGLRLLLDEGVSFTKAYHAHATTSTAPGHASLATGCYPSEHGIISNSWFDRATGDLVYSVDDERDEKSPRRMECSTIGDWLKGQYPKSRVFAVSGKDRSAVLMGGYRADGVYWYDYDVGTFISSSYYRRAVPPWLEELNSEAFLERRFGQVWEPLPFEPELLEELGVVSYDLGPLEEDFPHAIGGLSTAPDENFFWDVRWSPWLDEYMLELVRRLVTAEDLGGDAYPDLLALGFSTTDIVGHEHGPDSREFFDILVRLDRLLGEFFQFLDRSVGLDDVAIVLSSDHGSVPVPELRVARGLSGARAGAEEISCVQQTESILDKEFGEARWLLPGPFFAPLPAESDISRDELRQRTRALLEKCPSVARVWLAEEIRRAGGSAMQQRFAHSYFPERSPDFAVQWEEFFLSTQSRASSHGTPYGYDSHVPLIFWRAATKPANLDDPVRTVDLAPTVATWLGIEPPQAIAGRNLEDASR